MSTETTKRGHIGAISPAVARSLSCRGIGPAWYARPSRRVRKQLKRTPCRPPRPSHLPPGSAAMLRYRGRCGCCGGLCCGAAGEKPLQNQRCCGVATRPGGGAIGESGRARSPPMCDPLHCGGRAPVSSDGTGFSLLRHPGLAQSGEIGRFIQGADLWHCPPCARKARSRAILEKISPPSNL